MTATIKSEHCENGAPNIPELTEDSTHVEEEDICELEHLRKLFIGGLASQTTEESLKAFYGKWGTVVDAVVMRDPTTKRSRGFGFITYTKAASVDEAQKNRPHVIDNKPVDPKRALPRPERETRETNISVKKLFVGGLKDNHDEKCLEEYFSKFGNVVSVKILTDKTTGKRRGFAFIEYDDYDSVDKAILQRAHTIKYVVVDVKKSVYKQENKGNEGGNSDTNNALNSSKQNSVGLKPTNARPPVPQQPMPPYQQGPQPAPYQQGTPYNYWGQPQQPPPHQYNPYPQPPTNGWNTPYGWNGWNAGPPPPQQAPPTNWYGNQWPQNTGPAPVPQPPVGPAPNGNWNAPPVNGPPQQPGPPANFGNGYQQNYGGGPAKNNPPHTNRMHPYAPPQQNGNYANTNQQAPPQAYNGYGPNKQPSAPIPPSKNGAPPNTAAQMANKFRR